jgi:GntR family transcriptional repressor for pyruvate dehydrogenase complex
MGRAPSGAMLSCAAQLEPTAPMPPSIPLFDKVRPRRTYEEVATRIRRSFADGAVKPGDKLPADDVLARRLGVSRGALREALRALEVAGVVELRTGRNGGAYISGGKPKVLSDNMVDLLHLQSVTIEQLTEARIWIEDIIVRAACARATEEDLAALDANVAHARELYRQGRLAEKAAVNIDFHNLLAQATKNPFLVIVTGTLTEVMAAFVRETSADAGPATFTSRKRFMAAMRARDAEAAVEEMRKNLRRVNKVYEKLALDKARAQLAPPPRTPSRAAGPAKKAAVQRR